MNIIINEKLISQQQLISYRGIKESIFKCNISIIHFDPDRFKFKFYHLNVTCQFKCKNKIFNGT